MPELSEESKVRLTEMVEGIDPEEAEGIIVRAIARDFNLYRERNLMIKNKAGQIVPFQLNWAQEKLLEMILQDIAAGRPVRYILLKARQMGMSTLIEALCYWWTATHKNIGSVIMAHERDAAKNLYEMFRRFHQYSHELFRPSLKYNTKSDLTFDVEQEVKDEALAAGEPVPGLGSQIMTSVAKSGSGRSQTNQFFHGCISADSKIILFDGSSKKMKDIAVGDELIAEDGEKTRVQHIWSTGEKEVIEISSWLGNEPIRVSKDHKIRVAKKIGKKGKRLGGHEWKLAGDLDGSEYILWPHHSTHAYTKFLTLDIDRCVYERPAPTKFGGVVTKKPVIKTDYTLGYLFGYYLAEGHIRKTRTTVEFAMHKDEEFYKKFEDLIPCKKKVLLVDGTNKKTVTFYSAPMARLLDKHVGRVADKHVPMEWVKNMPRQFLIGLYEGWKDGDGSKTDESRCSITTIQERIARPMRQIFVSLYKRVPSLHLYQNRERYGVETKDAFIFEENFGVNKPQCKSKFVMPRGDNRGSLYIKLKSVEKKGCEQTYDLEVDHPSHSFLTTTGIVSNSEVGFWEDSADIVSGMLQTIPSIPGTFAFLESTANGVGNFFFSEWMSAEKGESAFKPVFFAWHDHLEYELDASKGLAPYSIRELEVVEILKGKELDEEQIQRKIAWRRMKSLEFKSDPKKFDQEYPDTPMIAFLSSGNYAFPMDKLLLMRDQAQNDASFSFGELYIDSEKKWRVREVEQSPLKVWYPAEPGRKYVIGGDVAEGIEVSSATGKEGDYSVADVMDVETGWTVARWRGHIDPDEFANVLFQLGSYYNNALVGPEVNNHGILVVQKLIDKFYRNVFRRENAEDEQFQESTSKMGFKTTMVTKPLIIQQLNAAIRDGYVKDLDPVFVGEAMTYMQDNKGRYNGSGSNFDDCVMAKAIALHLALTLTHNVQYAKDHISKNSKVIQKHGSRDAAFEHSRFTKPKPRSSGRYARRSRFKK